MSKVAVIGNTARAIGAVCASDLTLSGHEVRYTVFPEQMDQLPAVRKAGGFTVEGDAKHLIAKKPTAKLDGSRHHSRSAENAEAVLISRRAARSEVPHDSRAPGACARSEPRLLAGCAPYAALTQGGPRRCPRDRSARADA
jgi:hypothetical protein